MPTGTDMTRDERRELVFELGQTLLSAGVSASGRKAGVAALDRLVARPAALEQLFQARQLVAELPASVRVAFLDHLATRSSSDRRSVELMVRLLLDGATVAEASDLTPLKAETAESLLVRLVACPDLPPGALHGACAATKSAEQRFMILRLLDGESIDGLHDAAALTAELGDRACARLGERFDDNGHYLAEALRRNSFGPKPITGRPQTYGARKGAGHREIRDLLKVNVVSSSRDDIVETALARIEADRLPEGVRKRCIRSNLTHDKVMLLVQLMADHPELSFDDALNEMPREALPAEMVAKALVAVPELLPLRVGVLRAIREYTMEPYGVQAFVHMVPHVPEDRVEDLGYAVARIHSDHAWQGALEMMTRAVRTRQELATSLLGAADERLYWGYQELQTAVSGYIHRQRTIAGPKEGQETWDLT